jgi:hypothetical protein
VNVTETPDPVPTVAFDRNGALMPWQPSGNQVSDNGSRESPGVPTLQNLHDECYEQVNQALAAARTDLVPMLQNLWSLSSSVETGATKGPVVGALEGYTSGIVQLDIEAGVFGAAVGAAVGLVNGIASAIVLAPVIN